MNLNESLILKVVLYILEFSFNLISISSLTRALKYSFVFTNGACIQDASKRMIGSGRLVDRLYYLDLQLVQISVSNIVSNKVCSSVSIPDYALWHFRLGHISNSVLEGMCSQFPYLHVNKRGICDVCHFAKQKRLPYTISSYRALHCFELSHMDIWGPFVVSSIHGPKYFLTVADDDSRFTWVIMLKGKFEVEQQVQKFVNLVEKQYNVVVRRIRSDNGPEFKMPSFYASKGIFHECSCVETPQQNGRVKRKHQHVLSVARALLF